MHRPPTDLLGDLLQRARKAGADAADAMLVESGALAVTWRLGKLEKVERAESHDLGLRLFVGRRQAIVSTGELAALDRLVAQAVAIAKAVPEDRYAGLAEPEQVATALPQLDLDDGVEPGVEALADLAGAAEEAALAHPKISNSEGAEAGWSRSRTTLVATNGFAGTITRSSHGLSAAVIAGGNGAMER
ncbi:MAG TPA: DNA gyrase modulator, partial [Geminicoccaceae bacterium]|nr:DNA gyrase modulator [Geminicoccaceae bacterium]